MPEMTGGEDFAVEFKDFTFKYDAQVEPTLKHVNLTIRPGERVLICGQSGCGKSTLAHCVNGLIPAQYPGERSGSLRVFGKDAAEQGIFGLSRLVGTVLQDPDGQFIGLTVGEDIAFALENDATPLVEMQSRVNGAAELVDVDGLLSRAPHELSGGQRQRVALAGVMVDDVRLLLFDEPLANLDPATGAQAMELIDDIARRTGDTVIIIEHRLEDVLHCPLDRIVLMQDGEIIADGAPDELLCRTELTRAGIREPLYITALRYAGIDVIPDMHPGRMDTLLLSDAQRAQLRGWYAQAEKPLDVPRGTALLAARDVQFAYPNDALALDGVNFEIARGELTGIVGRNGAGKSTLSRLICGFERPQHGALLLDGRDITSNAIGKRAQRIGYVMQNPNQMISHAMIFDEVAAGLRARGVDEGEIAKKVEATLDVCGLRPYRAWPISALSFGQKKRVTIASILALSPDIIILDEPTAGQDFRHYTDIMEFLRELNSRGTTILMITHDMHLMLEYCSRALVLLDGRIIGDDSPAGILTDSDTVERASLRLTSLYSLARLAGIADPREFTRRFISRDRREREK